MNRRTAWMLVLFLSACGGAAASSRTDTPAAAAHAAEPTDPVAGPDQQALVARAAAAVTSGDAAASQYFASMVIVGPALWRTLQTDPALAAVGHASTFVVPVPGHPVQLEGRMFTGPDVAVFLAASGFVGALRNVGPSATARAADHDERAIYYALVPWEITGKPVTVLGEGDGRLLFDADEGHIVWIDAVQPYIQR